MKMGIQSGQEQSVITLYNSGFSIVQTIDSCYAIGSYILRDFTSSNFAIFKIDPNGDSLSSYEFEIGGKVNGRCLNVTADGGFILNGAWTPLPGSVVSHGMLMKTRADGETLWVRDYGIDIQSILNQVVELEDGGFIACGELSGSGGDYDILVMKVGAHGDSIWVRTFAHDSIASATSLIKIPGKIITAGYLAPISVIDNNDVSLHCLDDSGALLWHNEIGGRFLESANDIIQACSGDLVVIGTKTYTPSMTQDVYLLRCSIDGDSMWAQTYDSGVIESGKKLLQTPDGGFLLGASRGDVGMNSEIYIIKTDSLGVSTTIPEIKKEEGFCLTVFPNPFNSYVSISTNSVSEIEIYNLNGKMIKHIEGADSQQVWDGTDNCNTPLPNGIYFIKDKTTGKQAKVVLMK